MKEEAVRYFAVREGVVVSLFKFLGEQKFNDVAGLIKALESAKAITLSSDQEEPKSSDDKGKDDKPVPIKK